LTLKAIFQEWLLGYGLHGNPQAGWCIVFEDQEDFMKFKKETPRPHGKESE